MSCLLVSILNFIARKMQGFTSLSTAQQSECQCVEDTKRKQVVISFPCKKENVKDPLRKTLIAETEFHIIKLICFCFLNKLVRFFIFFYFFNQITNINLTVTEHTKVLLKQNLGKGQYVNNQRKATYSVLNINFKLKV